MEHGALDYRECVADDVQPGKQTSFPQSVKLKEDEVVIFSYIVYKSRAHRDSVNKKVMSDPRLDDMMDPKVMPFDSKRMIFGGFETLVEVKAGAKAKKAPAKSAAKRAPSGKKKGA
jgi:uncharacterized protein YbaA (DUF1428 family)